MWGKANPGEKVTVTAGTSTGSATAGPDGKWRVDLAPLKVTKAVIDGETVVVSSDQVKQPVAVRYGWANNPACHLYNGEGLPASPFRTDDWPDALPSTSATNPAISTNTVNSAR